MLKFTYRKTVKERVTAKCARHPRFNPEKEGRNGIKGGCSTCWQLFDLHQARLRLDAAIHEFERKALPWVALVKKRKDDTRPEVVHATAHQLSASE